jgi:hypothetical protein
MNRFHQILLPTGTWINDCIAPRHGNVDICEYLGLSPSDPPFVVHLFLDPEKYMTNLPSMQNLPQKIPIGCNLRLSSSWLPAPLDHLSCAMGKWTILDSSASFVTVYISQTSCGRRMVHPVKMIASTWTRVATARTEGLN